MATLVESNGYSSLSRVMIRGFTAADQDEMRDGMTDRGFTFPPIENVQRIEVLNGLSGFLYGFSEVGGTINYVTKDPILNPMAEISTGSMAAVWSMRRPISAGRSIPTSASAIA